ncbi:putative nicotinate-nucleotide adenylyltransferase [Desulfosarcina alkanivorans]|uniref:Probable nicotinate-nucleotide adenylyltransferase n=1 Tax=Desulfosarcina alkanivorans TaxID=571177 RepID=A0A5K7YR13_9BACT|nr:nicotinate-nucleotide adenylyltransferase [Desulfosarcina alkanivorans]BBO70733.1 putative nicotinate-nucleotide adenylyltransferase [Desulfosarcina alkanivorans]
MRAGLFGGTFNPIHRGHLMAAERVLDHFSLDRLYIIPCRVPPHKFPAYLAPAGERMRMIQLALPADPRYQLSDVEIQRSGPSYTIDTVVHFRTRIIPGAELFLITGMDAFLEIHTWKNQRRLLELIQPVVVSRPGSGPTPARDDAGRLDGYIRSRLSGVYHYCELGTCWREAGGSCIHLLPTAPVDISSSRVRQRIRAGKTIGDLVPDTVNAYIERKGLYR